MTSLSTDAFPFTLTYVCELLGVDEPRLMALCKSLSIQPHEDPGTGRLYFGTKQLDVLRNAVEAQPAAPGANRPAVPTAPVTPRTVAPTPAKAGYASVPATASSSGLSRSEISSLVESVSHAKEEILRDLSMLLDEKLAGLDEVVVELIRSKSENDSLREELKRLEDSRNELRSELSKFKPSAFGFYRKES